jgi:hypothetical protein
VRRFSNYGEARPLLTKLKGETRERNERLVAAFLREWHTSDEKTIEQAYAVSQHSGYPSAKTEHDALQSEFSFKIHMRILTIACYPEHITMYETVASFRLSSWCR